MTQTVLAQLLDVNLPTVNRWLNRDVLPDGASLVKLPAILVVDGHWLLTGEGEMVRKPMPEETQAMLDEIAAIVDKARNVKLTRPLIPRPRPPEGNRESS